MRRVSLVPDGPSAALADDDLADSRPSKSERKRQMHDLQALGVALVELPEARAAALDLPEPLRDALAQYRRVRSHEGKRRQMQFIGKLMRKIDDAPVREAVAAAQLGSAKETLALHTAERWREELLASDDALTRWMTAVPSTNAQQLRNLIRAARKDAAAVAAASTSGGDVRHGRSYRELFVQIKSGLAELARAQSVLANDDDEADNHG